MAASFVFVELPSLPAGTTFKAVQKTKRDTRSSSSSTTSSKPEIKSTKASSFKFSKAISGSKPQKQKQQATSHSDEQQERIGTEITKDKAAATDQHTTQRTKATPNTWPEPSSSLAASPMDLIQLLNSQPPSLATQHQQRCDAAYEISDEGYQCSGEAGPAPSSSIVEPAYTVTELPAGPDKKGSYQIKVHLPEAQSGADADVQTGPKLMQLHVPGRYHLEVALANAIDTLQTKAKWSKAKKTLTLILPQL